MSFQLTISEGQESGKAFVFEQPSITIGRTDECDVVLYDSGVSRQHARIFSEGPSYFVEDLGSANGTRVNGQAVKKQALLEGDAVSLGAVVFTFSGKTPPMLAPTNGNGANALAPATVQSTRIVSADEMNRKPRAFVPANASAEEVNALGRKQTTALSADQVNQAIGKAKSAGVKRQGLERFSSGRLSAAD